MSYRAHSVTPITSFCKLCGCAYQCQTWERADKQICTGCAYLKAHPFETEYVMQPVFQYETRTT